MSQNPDVVRGSLEGRAHSLLAKAQRITDTASNQNRDLTDRETRLLDDYYEKSDAIQRELELMDDSGSPAAANARKTDPNPIARRTMPGSPSVAPGGPDRKETGGFRVSHPWKP